MRCAERGNGEGERLISSVQVKPRPSTWSLTIPVLKYDPRTLE